MSLHCSGDFNKFMQLYCRGPTLCQIYNRAYRLFYKAIPIQLKLTLFRPERKSVTTNSSDNRRNYIALLSFWFVDVDLHGDIKFV